MREQEQLPASVARRIDLIKEHLGAIARGARSWDEVEAEVEADLDAAVVGAVEAAAGPVVDEPDGEPVDLAAVVAANMRALRIEAGWTQAAVAEAMTRVGFDWKRITVAEVEAGGRRLQLEELFAVAGLYGMPVVELLVPHRSHPVAWFDRTLPAAVVAELVLGRDDKPGVGGPDWLPGVLMSRQHSGRPAHDFWRSTRERRHMAAPRR